MFKSKLSKIIAFSTAGLLIVGAAVIITFNTTQLGTLVTQKKAKTEPEMKNKFTTRNKRAKANYAALSTQKEDTESIMASSFKMADNGSLEPIFTRPPEAFSEKGDFVEIHFDHQNQRSQIKQYLAYIEKDLAQQMIDSYGFPFPPRGDERCKIGQGLGQNENILMDLYLFSVPDTETVQANAGTCESKFGDPGDIGGAYFILKYHTKDKNETKSNIKRIMGMSYVLDTLVDKYDGVINNPDILSLVAESFSTYFQHIGFKPADDPSGTTPADKDLVANLQRCNWNDNLLNIKSEALYANKTIDYAAKDRCVNFWENISEQLGNKSLAKIMEQLIGATNNADVLNKIDRYRKSIVGKQFKLNAAQYNKYFMLDAFRDAYSYDTPYGDEIGSTSGLTEVPSSEIPTTRTALFDKSCAICADGFAAQITGEDVKVTLARNSDVTTTAFLYNLANDSYQRINIPDFPASQKFAFNISKDMGADYIMIVFNAFTLPGALEGDATSNFKIENNSPAACKIEPGGGQGFTADSGDGLTPQCGPTCTDPNYVGSCAFTLQLGGSGLGAIRTVDSTQDQCNNTEIQNTQAVIDCKKTNPNCFGQKYGWDDGNKGICQQQDQVHFEKYTTQSVCQYYNETKLRNTNWSWKDDQDPVGTCGALSGSTYKYRAGEAPDYLVAEAFCNSEKLRLGGFCKNWAPGDPNCQDVWVEEDTSSERSCTQ